MYHTIDEGDSQYSISPATFELHLTVLAEGKYVVENFEQLLTRLRGSNPLPSKYVVLSFDDGDKSAQTATEILERYGLKGSFFVTRDRSLTDSKFLSPIELRSLRACGAHIGTHGTTHKPLGLMGAEQRVAELRESKLWLEEILSERVEHMTLPGGFSSDATIEDARCIGYQFIGTSFPWYNTAEKILNSGIICRIAMRKQISIQKFTAIIESGIYTILPQLIRYGTLWLPKQIAFRNRI